MVDRALTAAEIEPLLERWLEAEFTRHPMGPLAARIAELPPGDQAFVLDWTRRTASAHIHIAHVFAREAPRMVGQMDRRTVEAWVLHALDEVDREGLQTALGILRDPARFVRSRHAHAAGAVFDDIAGVLRGFIRGLSGRELRLEQGDEPWTDSETLYLPPVVAGLESAHDNFVLAKATVTLLWAQTRFGTFRPDLVAEFARHDDPDRAARCFLALETLRLEASIARELPGLGREMARLRRLGGAEDMPACWLRWRERLARAGARVDATLALLDDARDHDLPPAPPYQTGLRSEAVAAAKAARIEREKVLLRVRLADMAEESRRKAAAPPRTGPPRFEVAPPEVPEIAMPEELWLDGIPMPIPEDVRQLLASVRLDLDDIPPEYLVPAGDGEYDPNLYRPRERDPDDVWQGTYHEEGAELYPEWDFGRQHYRKNWCVLREKDVPPVDDGFVEDVLARYSGLARQLRRTFEALRDQDRRERRQVDGDDLDFDALVEAVGDAHAGRDMSDRLFTRLHRSERDIAALFLVDMSGSTEGWINEAERAALLLLCEAVEALGDRYAVCGFSGMTRKKCEWFRIKGFDERYGDTVRGRIAGIRPQDYTRMGVAIRHATRLLSGVEARTRLLVTLSDGRPDDYHDNYRGRYGIEDTRRALLEATRAGIRPFCITLDRESRDYLPHLYGAARYTVVDDVARLPYKFADIYRRLTTA